ncbi:MAG: hypothetical protein HY330_05285 [Chloroflexi bacterium]|nr:hypothetical protein [Chloroflexota bacterium]
MVHSKGIRKLALMGVLGVPALLVACAGVSQADYDAAKKQAEERQQQATALQQQLSAKVQEASDAQKKLADKDKELADLQQKAKAAGPSDVTILIGAKAVPTPTPAPPPTPLPPGSTPPPRPTTPASYDQPVPFTFFIETLATTRPSTYGVAATINCLNTNAFKRGQRIVWRFEVFDTSTGKRLTDKDAPTVKVRLPHGEEVTARWSQRAGGRVPDAPWMWNTTWDIPLNYPLGGLDYAVTVSTKDGRNFTWKQPALVSKDLGLDTRLTIFE